MLASLCVAPGVSGCSVAFASPLRSGPSRPARSPTTGWTRTATAVTRRAASAHSARGMMTPPTRRRATTTPVTTTRVTTTRRLRQTTTSPRRSAPNLRGQVPALQPAARRPLHGSCRRFSHGPGCVGAVEHLGPNPSATSWVIAVAPQGACNPAGLTLGYAPLPGLDGFLHFFGALTASMNQPRHAIRRRRLHPMGAAKQEYHHPPHIDPPGGGGGERSDAAFSDAADGAMVPNWRGRPALPCPPWDLGERFSNPARRSRVP